MSIRSVFRDLRASFFPRMLFRFLFLTVVITVGCQSESEKEADLKQPDALQQMLQAMANEDWSHALELTDKVLVAHNHDADVLSQVALVAFNNDQKELSAGLLVDACRAEGFRDAGRVQQALVGLLSIGKLFDGMTLLDSFVEANPENDDVRRSLYDFLVGTEQHIEAEKHGKILIRRRAFDTSLLENFIGSDARNAESDSLKVMVERNPTDRRPLIGLARHHIDDIKYPEAIEVCKSIIQSNPDFTEAHAMLGIAYSRQADFKSLEEWILNCPASIVNHSQYWKSFAELAVHKQHPEIAIQALTIGGHIAPNDVELWRKFNLALSQSRDNEDVGQSTRQLVAKRGALLSSVRHLYRRFNTTGSRSPEIAIQIANSLVELGRLWEAEAWIALALTFQENSDQQREVLMSERSKIVAQLKSSTPWQQPIKMDLPSANANQMRNQLVVALTGQTPHKTSAAPTAKASPPKPIIFRNEASERGINFFARTSESLDRPGIPIYHTLGCGGATLDYDLDGWPDLYLATGVGSPMKRNSRANQLYRNLDGQFQRVPQRVDAADRGFTHGVAVGDLNEDGFPDILVANYGLNRVWINQGDGTYRDTSALWISDDQQWSTSAAIADLDADGLSDAFVLNYCEPQRPVSELCDSDESSASRNEGNDQSGPRACSPVYFAAQPDQVLKGQSSGGLLDVTNSWNVRAMQPGRGLGLIVGNFDDQTGCEVFVANDMSSNHFWTSVQLSSNSWHDTAALCGVDGNSTSSAQGSMGIAIDDINSDAIPDIFVTNFENEYNTMLLSSASQSYRDATTEFDLVTSAIPLVGFGTQFVDFDANGSSELVISNGHVDHFSKPGQEAFYTQPFQLYQRDSNGAFVLQTVSEDEIYRNRLHCGRAMWTIDANQDGQQDLVLTHQTEEVALLVNATQTTYRSLELKLVGTESSRDAIGTTVSITYGDHVRHLSVNSGNGYLCSNPKSIHCGIGNYNGVLSVKAKWPNGKQQQWSLNISKHSEPGCWILIQSGDAFFAHEKSEAE